MRDKNSKIAIMAVCLLVGILMAIQFRTSQSYDVNLRGTRSDEMAFKINSLIQEKNALSQEVVSLREKLTKMGNGDQITAELQSELKKANMTAGLTAVRGPGIIVTLNDIPHVLQRGEDPNYYLVHDRDIADIVNEMRASGAEAISINNERVTAVSEIRCAGTTIMVNKNRITPPFEIKAIGNPKNLESGLSILGGKLWLLSSDGFPTKLEQKDSIDIPPYKGTLKFEFASPI
ncbi:MAG: DUF881 domain-containing protein [Syntrophomonadaceae bacterium]|nr:DUF881 domain-containing protein [Syntrophomonadaceae bacterium]